MSGWPASLSALGDAVLAVFGEAMTFRPATTGIACRGMVQKSVVDLIDGQIQFGQPHYTIVTDLPFSAAPVAGDEMLTAAGVRYRIECPPIDSDRGLMELSVRKVPT